MKVKMPDSKYRLQKSSDTGFQVTEERLIPVHELKRLLDSGEFAVNRVTLEKLKQDKRKTVRAIYLSLKKRIENEKAEKSRVQRLYYYEEQLWESGIRVIAGVDEVGVGPLAGPVVAAAVVFRPSYELIPVDDSKRLSESKRESLLEQILEKAQSVGIGIASPVEIDHLNVYQATLLAMRRAVNKLDLKPEHVLVDARRIQGISCNQTSIIKGDSLSFSIASASIVAKTHRDRLMRIYDSQYPGYGFRNHKGYPTAAHREAILQYGPCPIHRQSFRLTVREKFPQPSLFPKE